VDAVPVASAARPGPAGGRREAARDGVAERPAGVAAVAGDVAVAGASVADGPAAFAAAVAGAPASDATTGAWIGVSAACAARASVAVAATAVGVPSGDAATGEAGA
jgi:hypothetical protein